MIRLNDGRWGINFKEEKESVAIINNEIQANYLEQIVLLLNEILDATIPFEEKIL